MPKRPRQAHIPTQLKRRRVTPRRPTMPGSVPGDLAPEGLLAAEGAYAGATASAATATAPAAPVRTGRRLEQLRSQEAPMGVRIAPGQLPTFERTYLVRELRQIGAISGSLLAVIIVLSFVLR